MDAIWNAAERRLHAMGVEEPSEGQYFSEQLHFSAAEVAGLQAALAEELHLKIPGDVPLPETVGALCLRLRQAQEKRKAKRVVTAPNAMSLLRLLLIPVYAELYLQAKTPADYWLSASILALSCLTDLFDGLVARHFDQVTDLGKVLDPIADKATQGVVLLCLTPRIPALWSLFWLFVGKELFQLAASLYHLRHGRILPGALRQGKVATAIVFSGVTVLVAVPELPAPLVTILCLLCVAALGSSFVAYVRAYFGRTGELEEL